MPFIFIWRGRIRLSMFVHLIFGSFVALSKSSHTRSPPPSMARSKKETIIDKPPTLPATSPRATLWPPPAKVCICYVHPCSAAEREQGIRVQDRKRKRRPFVRSMFFFDARQERKLCCPACRPPRRQRRQPPTLPITKVPQDVTKRIPRPTVRTTQQLREERFRAVYGCSRTSALCAVCGVSRITYYPGGNMQLAHVQSAHMGGTATAANLFPTCGCNQRYGTQNILDYMGLRHDLRDKRLMKVALSLWKLSVPPAARRRAYHLSGKDTLIHFLRHTYKPQHLPAYRTWLKLDRLPR